MALFVLTSLYTIYDDKLKIATYWKQYEMITWKSAHFIQLRFHYAGFIFLNSDVGVHNLREQTGLTV